MIQIKCPICGRRLLDVSKLPREELTLEVKSPCCRKIVSVNLNNKNIKKSQIEQRNLGITK